MTRTWTVQVVGYSPVGVVRINEAAFAYENVGSVFVSELLTCLKDMDVKLPLDAPLIIAPAEPEA